VTDGAGKRVIITSDGESGKPMLINEILGIPDLCKITSNWEPSSQVTYTYRYREDTNIAASIHILSSISLLASHTSHTDEVKTGISATDRMRGVDLEEVVCPDVASFHAAISKFTGSAEYVVKEINVFIKSAVLAGDVRIVELP
jgi:hypothetical protein